MNPGKHWPTAHQLECGPPSAASMNCLVSPWSWESRPFPQSSLYTQYLVVHSLAVYSACFLQCRSDHHYLGMASSTVYCLIIAGQSVQTALLGVPLDLGLSTFTHVKASSPSSWDLTTIACVFF